MLGALLAAAAARRLHGVRKPLGAIVAGGVIGAACIFAALFAWVAIFGTGTSCRGVPTP